MHGGTILERETLAIDTVQPVKLRRGVKELFLDGAPEENGPYRDKVAHRLGLGARQLYELELHFIPDIPPSSHAGDTDRVIATQSVDSWCTDRLAIVEKLRQEIQVQACYENKSEVETAAMALAEFAHLGQWRKVGTERPTTTHTAVVANVVDEVLNAETSTINPDFTRAVAVVAHLHDALEALFEDMEWQRKNPKVNLKKIHPCFVDRYPPINPLKSSRFWVTPRMVETIFAAYDPHNPYKAMAVEALVLLSKRYDFSGTEVERVGRDGYLDEIAENTIATIVKIGDTTNNLLDIDMMPIDEDKRAATKHEYVVNTQRLSQSLGAHAHIATTIASSMDTINMTDETRLACRRRELAIAALSSWLSAK